jgi:hypothetical protein
MTAMTMPPARWSRETKAMIRGTVFGLIGGLLLSGVIGWLSG